MFLISEEQLMELLVKAMIEGNRCHEDCLTVKDNDIIIPIIEDFKNNNNKQNVPERKTPYIPNASRPADIFNR